MSRPMPARDVVRVQASEKTEHTTMILFRDTDAIVADSYHPIGSDAFRRDVNFGWRLAAILHRVPIKFWKSRTRSDSLPCIVGNCPIVTVAPVAPQAALRLCI